MQQLRLIQFILSWFICSDVLQTITGDFESRFNILVRAKREQRDHQTISDYRLQVERLRGRLNASTDFRDGAVAIKFDGWPDVIFLNW
jgi:hypothetical protein